MNANNLITACVGDCTTVIETHMTSEPNMDERYVLRMSVLSVLVANYIGKVAFDLDHDATRLADTFHDLLLRDLADFPHEAAR